jgi:choline dehydrogenase-like flavoprotein
LRWGIGRSRRRKDRAIGAVPRALIYEVDQLDAKPVADVCVLGAGAAGIAIARELDGCGARVLVLESGGRDFDQRTQDLYLGQVVGLPHGGLSGYRFRVFGGSTRRWAGQALPLSELDFAARDWVPESGWPFGLEELAPYYQRVAALMGIERFPPEDSTAWPAALAPPPPFDPGLVRPRFSQFSPEPDFARRFGAQLEASANVEVVLGANLTELVPDPALGGIDFARVASLGGRRFEVRAERFVLCLGGLETPRILLASDRRCEGGLGNGHDLVGRCLQDHAGLVIGRLASADAGRLRRTFRPRRGGGLKYAPLLAAGDALQREERILNAAGMVQFGGRAASDAAAKTLVRAFGRSQFAAQARAEAPAAARTVLRDPLPVLRAAGRRFLLRQPGFDTSGTPVLAVGGEQAPNRDSRVFLSAERDELGVARLALDWRVTELDLRSWRRFAEVVAGELERTGWASAELELGKLPDDPGAVSGLVDAGHHIGTTRMAVDPREGVVDPDCRVHGLENLFVASSSVFPTGGFSNPTFTILALALRLADRLRAGTPRAEAAHAA